MSTISRILQHSMKRLERKLGTPVFIWHGLQFPCIATTIRRGTEVVVGGHLVTIDLTILVRQNARSITITADNTIVTVDTTGVTVDQNANPFQLVDFPNTVNLRASMSTIKASSSQYKASATRLVKEQTEPLNTLMHGRRQYRILTVGDAPGGSHYEIDLTDPNR